MLSTRWPIKQNKIKTYQVETNLTFKLTKQNLPDQTYQTVVTNQTYQIKVFQTKLNKLNLPNQTHQTKSAKPNLGTKIIYLNLKTKPNLPNQA